MNEDKTNGGSATDEAFSNVVCIRFGCLEFDVLNEPSDMVM